jgi:tetratricopeptide (TPR) repeat protein
MPARLFLSSGDLMADRRFEFARDLQLKGDLAAAADLLLQAIEIAPNFVSAWFTLGEIRNRLGQRDSAIAAFRKARAGDSGDRHGAGLHLMRLGAEQISAMPRATGLCENAVRPIRDSVRGCAGERSRLPRAGAVVQGRAVGSIGCAQAGVL